MMLINIPWCLTGSKLISIRRPVASANLDSIYLTLGKGIDEGGRFRAPTAYMAVNTGELDLTTGRAESRKRRNQQQRLKVMWLI